MVVSCSYLNRAVNILLSFSFIVIKFTTVEKNGDNKHLSSKQKIQQAN